MNKTNDAPEIRQMFNIINDYDTALTLLDDYDHQRMSRPQGHETTYILTYDECRRLIETMRFNIGFGLFGHEKDDSFRGSIGDIYQTFAGKDVYLSVEEKAANLLYFVTKNHSSMTEINGLRQLSSFISLTVTAYCMTNTVRSALRITPSLR